MLLESFVGVSHAQDSLTHGVGFAAGMGVSVINVIDVVDYVNGISVSQNRIDDFATAAEFFVASELFFRDSWGVKIEYAYLLQSYTIDQDVIGRYEIFYSLHMPTFMIHYVDLHPEYVVKVGGGLGYHAASLSETLQGAAARHLKSSGIGLKVEAEVNTALGERLYGFFGGDIRVNFMNVLKDAQGNTLRIQGRKDAKMSFFAFGLKLGIIYYV